jgi:hypothetical protein
MDNAVILKLRKTESTFYLLDFIVKFFQRIFIIIISIPLILYCALYLMGKILSTNCIFEGGAIEIAVHGPYCLEKSDIQSTEDKQNEFGNKLKSYIGLNIRSIDSYLLSIGFVRKENPVNESGLFDRNLKYSEYRYQENHMLRSPTYWRVEVFSDSTSEFVKSIKVKFF